MPVTGVDVGTDAQATQLLSTEEQVERLRELHTAGLEHIGLIAIDEAPRFLVSQHVHMARFIFNALGVMDAAGNHKLGLWTPSAHTEETQTGEEVIVRSLVEKESGTGLEKAYSVLAVRGLMLSEWHRAPKQASNGKTGLIHTLEHRDYRHLLNITKRYSRN